jgi:hypothetical protein
MSEDRLQQFFDYKAITELKARFGRLADVKDWEGFAGVFTEDATFDLGDGNVFVGGRNYAYAVRDMLEGGRSLHRFLMPEINLISDTEASGIWMLNDYIEWGPDPVTGARSGFKGYGREYETYRKVGGEWKIASWRLRYDRMDPLPQEPLPATFTGGPDSLRDEAYLRAVINPLGS